MDFTSFEAERTADTHAAPSGENAFFTIGDLAREFGVTLRALRFYEDKGLLAPRREGLTRLYSPAERSRLAIILKGKKLGFTLAEIKAMVALREGTAPAGGLALTREKCVEQLALLETQKTEIEEAIGELRQMVAAFSSRSAA
ncbi:transcriptional regulator, MerR family [Ancylobacter novellus DSM 506]|jgi:DNA-binding transcriptional MerR regulator|uniref:Transcriptional regulator, MerR family n=1 Tax=Ancylobacter novellus (strain ATCC 8093 / DSM 506 / JCM 20403 / CCM 1077 / IAM 12100 / NBRC 12443 / NCIMB 10456) TaxID=639283 RepID=D6ZZZ8_ANCN5|nr:MerR family DNA-binding transcriptional regulator [Ancylobacter novellus]ADH87412.1 transcriptional regulator, MerR family [Ancylobacter novellus DSM 506]MDF2618693.1 transcriptional regulator, MerR family [Xanthobacteraceae bacterium]